MALQRRRVLAHLGALLRAPLGQRHTETGVGDPVAAAHQPRQEAAGDLVLALRARLEAGQALAQAVLDALVVAGLEVQAGQGLAAPVPAVQGVAAAQAERTGHRRAVMHGQEDQQVARHRARKMREEVQGQRRRIAVVVEGAQIEAVHRLQVGGAGLVAVQHAEADAGALHLGPLLADVLAVLVVHRAQVIVEPGPAGVVVPLVLHVVAFQPVGAERGVLVGAVEIDVGRGQAGALAQRLHGREQFLLRRQVAGEQPRPGHRRVGHRAQPLGEVVLAVARVGMRPGMVEHEFAMRVGLHVARRGGDQDVAVPQREVQRRPAPVRAQAAMAFQAGQESMSNKWVAAVMQSVPLHRGHRVEPVQPADGRHQ
ncbi:hypothetical protein NB713_002942 [Xanthomonas sacchari]|nr:hypothetical protein [Xanthomonas sacchari]